MKQVNFKKIGVVLISIIAGLYLLFLMLPFFLSPVLENYLPEISKSIEESSGFKVKIEKIKLITTPKLTAGVKINNIEAATADNDKFLDIDNFQLKLSLLPILLGNIELDLVSADNIAVDLKVKKDGKFLLEDSIPQPPEGDDEFFQTSAVPESSCSFIKLSNHLPDIKIKGHRITFIDMVSGKKYSFNGQDTEIKDFIINKKVKISGIGSIVLAGREQFKYDVKIFNKIMPDISLNEMVTAPVEQEEDEQIQEFDFNIIDVFKAIYKNNLIANVKADIRTSGTPENVNVDGSIDVDKLSIAVDGEQLPDSYLKLNFKGDKASLDSDIHTAKNEVTDIIGKFKMGKKPNVDMTFKSNADLENIFRLLNSVAQTFGINDLATIKANGLVDADFNIKSDMKAVNSSGYFKLKDANINYGLYKIALNKINANISFDNNMVNVKNAGFSILNNPLKLYGTIKQDSTINLVLNANKLPLKNLLLSLGQVDVLKENSFKSGTLSLNTTIKGNLVAPVPKANISIDKLNMKNIPADSTVIMPNLKITLVPDGDSFKGDAVTNNLKILNPALIVNIPSVKAAITDEEINFSPTDIYADKIKLVASGKIKDYMAEKSYMDFVTTGDIKSTLKGSIYPISQKMSLNYSMPELSTIIIPGFDKSKLQAKGNVSITGFMVNPILKGKFIIPHVSIPEIPVVMNNLTVNLNGPIAKGNGTLQEFISGGIKAQNLVADFLLKGDMFYLYNINGDSFDGKIKGDIDYNLKNTKTRINFSGYNMNATDAIYGSSGIKNALTGTLGFNTKMTLQGVTEEEMMKSLKGNLSFDVKEGFFSKLGRLENFLHAQNILANSIMKLAVKHIETLTLIKDTAKFSYIKGSMSFNNGWANLSSITTSGPSMAYYIKGKYNLLNATTNVVILGRLGSEVVALLGPVGDLSVDKLTSYIPKFGALTAVIIKSMTADPANENVANIPELSSGNTSYKDFKVVFNGGVESQSSVKSFKWLTKTDTSALDLKNSAIDLAKQFLAPPSQPAQNGSSTPSPQDIQKTTEDLKNLFKF